MLFGDCNLDGYYGDAPPPAWLLALRATRSVLYRLLFIALRWSTPTLLIFGDTVFVYNFVAANFSLLLALHRRIYASTSWPSMLRRLEHTAMLFNLNCVGLAEHEARDLTKRLEQPPDGGLADAASDAVASEPRQVTWRRFAQAWNSVVLALRRGDLVSDAERDALCFHALSGADAADFLGIREDEVYVIFPTMLSEPVLLVGRPPPRGVVVVPVGRALPPADARPLWLVTACAILCNSPHAALTRLPPLLPQGVRRLPAHQGARLPRRRSRGAHPPRRDRNARAPRPADAALARRRRRRRKSAGLTRLERLHKAFAAFVARGVDFFAAARRLDLSAAADAEVARAAVKVADALAELLGMFGPPPKRSTGEKPSKKEKLQTVTFSQKVKESSSKRSSTVKALQRGESSALLQKSASPTRPPREDL